jgi:hypothetical protein
MNKYVGCVCVACRVVIFGFVAVSCVGRATLGAEESGALAQISQIRDNFEAGQCLSSLVSKSKINAKRMLLYWQIKKLEI